MDLDDLRDLDDLHSRQLAFNEIHGLVMEMVRHRIDPHFAERERQKRVKRVAIHRLFKLLRITHERGNSPVRALYWMCYCGVYFVSEMTPERRQDLDYIKATWDAVEYK